MFRKLPLLVTIVLLVFLSTLPAGAQKKPTAAVASSALKLNVTSNVATVSACGDASQVQLNAAAISPNGNPIQYKWTTTGGTISGEGPQVTWNLAGLKPGYHKASLDIVSTGSEGVCQAFSSVTVLVNACAPVRPVCPAVAVTGPTSAGIDQPLTFTSNHNGGTPGITPVYNWTVSAGTIVEGQGTDRIKVDTKGFAGQTIRASLSLGGYNLECAADYAVTIPLPKVEGRRFDEFPDIARNDEKARLDNFVIELQNDPTTTGYVIVYPGKHGKRAEVQEHAGRVVDYLVNSRGLDQRRIVTLVGPKKDQLYVQLWLTPQGATPPNP
ncbi:MAG TPA: hypothetical protein VJS13_00690 [Pyrinomonadaceae bacterium]|nr:hypothetical protein [Pyrinomonadaceae bacterium]